MKPGNTWIVFVLGAALLVAAPVSAEERAASAVRAPYSVGHSQADLVCTRFLPRGH